jgi:chemotaxis protein CheX
MGSSGPIPTHPALKCTPLAAEAVTHVFRTVCDAEVTASGAFAPDLVAGGAVAAVIALVGDVEWSLLSGLPRRTACAAAERFAGEPIPFDSDDMGDAIGALTNMIAGNIKTRLGRENLTVRLSLPSVISGANLQILSQREMPSPIQRHTSPLGDLWTEMVAGVESGRTRAAGS